MGPPEAAARATWLAIAAATLVGAALRFQDLSEPPFWLDESASFLSIRHLWDRGPGSPVFVQASNPLYYALLWGWSQAFGDTAAALRSLSAVVGTACIPLGAALAGRLGGSWSAGAAAVLIALHPLHIHYSREARGYALWTLLLLLAVAALWRANVRCDRRSWSVAALVWLAAFGAHVFTLFALPATLACVLWASDRRAALRHWLVFAAAVALLSGGYALGVLQPALAAGAGSWLETSGWRPWLALTESLWALLPAGAYPGHLDALSLGSGRAVRWTPDAVALTCAALPLTIVPVVLARLRSTPGAAHDWRPLAALALVPLALELGVSWLRPVFLAGRYDLVAWPALSLLIALGIGALASPGPAAPGRPLRAIAATSLLALCAVPPIGRELLYDGGDRFDDRRASRLAELATSRDLAIVFSNDDDALAHGLHLAGFAGKLRPFPSWLGSQIAFHDSPRDLSAERAPDLARDAQALARQVRATWAAGGAVFWLRDALRLDGRGARSVLPARLEQQLRGVRIGRVVVDEGLAIDRLEPTRASR